MINVMVTLLLISIIGIVSCNLIISNNQRVAINIKFKDLFNLNVEDDNITYVNNLLRTDSTKVDCLFSTGKLDCVNRYLSLTYIKDKNLIKLQQTDSGTYQLLTYMYKDNKIIVFPVEDKY